MCTLVLYMYDYMSYKQYVLSLQNCVDSIVDRVTDQIDVLAGVSITVAVLLVS